MGKSRVAVSAFAGMAASLLLCAGFQQATAAATDVAHAPAGSSSAPEYLHWPVPAGSARYGAIDGKHIWQYVAEQAGIAEHYRDNGHPQFWGRLAGTPSDDADADWLLNKYRQIGLTDTHLQTINYFNPQWSAQSWGVSVNAGGKTLPLSRRSRPMEARQPAARNWIWKSSMWGLAAKRISRAVTFAAKPYSSSRRSPAIRPGQRTY